MKILVTGAAGFIGYHLVEVLVKLKYEVVGIDNINDYYDVNIKYDRLAESGITRDLVKDTGELLTSVKYNNYRFAKIDITNLTVLKDLFSKENFTYVINLAAQAGVRYSIINPFAYVQSNLVGFVNVLECCRHSNIEHLVYASSSSVYGNNKKTPFSESDCVDHPISLYAATKKSNELMAHTYSQLYKLPTTGLRFFTVYGPWGRPDMAPMLFASAIDLGKTINVFNHGEMQRDFTYVDDIVEGVVRVTLRKPGAELSSPYFRILNIGNSQPMQLLDFINIMERHMGKTAIKKMCPMQMGDVKITYSDTSQLKLCTGYKPKISLDEGVREFVSWYKTYKRCMV